MLQIPLQFSYDMGSIGFIHVLFTGQIEEAPCTGQRPWSITKGRTQQLGQRQYPNMSILCKTACLLCCYNEDSEAETTGFSTVACIFSTVNFRCILLSQNEKKRQESQQKPPIIILIEAFCIKMNYRSHKKYICIQFYHFLFMSLPSKMFNVTFLWEHRIHFIHIQFSICNKFKTHWKYYLTNTLIYLTNPPTPIKIWVTLAAPVTSSSRQFILSLM